MEKGYRVFLGPKCPAQIKRAAAYATGSGDNAKENSRVDSHGNPLPERAVSQLGRYSDVPWKRRGIFFRRQDSRIGRLQSPRNLVECGYRQKGTRVRLRRTGEPYTNSALALLHRFFADGKHLACGAYEPVGQREPSASWDVATGNSFIKSSSIKEAFGSRLFSDGRMLHQPVRIIRSAFSMRRNGARSFVA